MSGLVSDLSTDVFRLTKKYVSRSLAPFHGAYNTALSTAKSLTVASLTALVVIAIVTAISCILVVSSSLTYIALYSRIVPTAAHELDLHFDYGSAQPTALVNLSAPQYFDANDKMQPISQRLLYAGQTYNLILRMQLADAPDQVAMTVISAQCEMLYNNTLQARSITSMLLPYQSFPKRFIKRVIRFIPTLLGFYDDSIHVSHDLIEGEWTETSVPTTSIRVTLTTPNAKRLRIIHSSIHITAQLSGIRYFMYHYWFTSALVIGAIIFTVQLVSTIVVLIAAYIWWQYSTPLASPKTPVRRLDTYKSVVTEFDESAMKKQNDELDHLIRETTPDIPSIISAISGSSSSGSSEDGSLSRSASASNNPADTLFHDASPSPVVPEGMRHRHYSLGDDNVQQT